MTKKRPDRTASGTGHAGSHATASAIAEMAVAVRRPRSSSSPRNASMCSVTRYALPSPSLKVAYTSGTGGAVGRDWACGRDTPASLLGEVWVSPPDEETCTGLEGVRDDAGGPGPGRIRRLCTAFLRYPERCRRREEKVRGSWLWK
ncbi:hypothetical protein B0H12DRAFT_1147611 [Mycena haematopus]|nr:hypothetical protein B0H12DRAFT_1147611 [Mycena haematopus]